MLLRLGLLVVLSGDGYTAPQAEPEVFQAEAAVPAGAAPIAPAACDQACFVVVVTPPAPESNAFLGDVMILEKYRSFRESLSTP